MSIIYHLIPQRDWRAALERGVYEPPSLAAEGFIHASYQAQVFATASRWYAGQTDLLLLSIDTDRVQPPVVAEPPRNASDPRRAELFPHIYGPLTLDAVVQVEEFSWRDPSA